MKYLKIVKSVIFLLGFGLEVIHAQQTVPTSGGNATGSGGSESFSVGQVVYTSNVAVSGSVLQGIQQPFEIMVVTEVAEVKGITLQCSAYPNPAADYLILKIEGEILSKYIVSLYDLNGKLLIDKKVEDNETNISLKNLAPLTYFLKVVQMKQDASTLEIKTFKIIKN